MDIAQNAPKQCLWSRMKQVYIFNPQQMPFGIQGVNPRLFELIREEKNLAFTVR
jgi:hypothetical protein